MDIAAVLEASVMLILNQVQDDSYSIYAICSIEIPKRVRNDTANRTFWTATILILLQLRLFVISSGAKPTAPSKLRKPFTPSTESPIASAIFSGGRTFIMGRFFAFSTAFCPAPSLSPSAQELEKKLLVVRNQHATKIPVPPVPFQLPPARRRA